VITDPEVPAALLRTARRAAAACPRLALKLNRTALRADTGSSISTALVWAPMREFAAVATGRVVFVVAEMPRHLSVRASPAPSWSTR
jgi:hypothetical protein